MTGLVALFWRDGRSIDRPAFCRSVGVASDVRNNQVWSDGSVALAVTKASTTRESVCISQDEARNTAIVFDGRIDNVPELTQKIDIDPRQIKSDSDLVLAAYRKWGDECVSHVVGDFVFALWDGLTNRLTISRDHLGARSLYCHLTDDVCVVASCVESLWATGTVQREIDYRRVMDCLVEPLEGADYTSTFYQRITRIPPATVLSVDQSSTKQRSYWSLTDAPEVWEKSESDWLDGIRFHLRQAVECRLSSGRLSPGRPSPSSRSHACVGSMLSGGIDSSAIAVQIHQIGLAQDAPSNGTLSNGALLCPDFVNRHPILSFAFDHDSSSADSRFSRELSSHLGLANERIGRDEIDIAELDDLFLGSPGSPFDSFMLMAAAIYSRAKKLGLTAVLDGIDGDLVFGMHGSYIPSLIRGGRIVTAFREIAAAHETSVATVRGVAANVLNTLPSSLHLWRTTKTGEMAMQRVRSSIVCEDFARSHDVVSRFEELRQWGKPNSMESADDFRREQAAWMVHPFATVGMERYQRVANHFGIEPRHPLFDVRLLEYCVNLPWEMRTRDGWTKYGLRKSISPAVPASVCWRSEFDNLYPRVASLFLRRHSDRLEAFVEDELRPSLGDIVDVEKVELRMREFQAGDAYAGLDVWQALQLSQWLKSSEHRCFNGRKNLSR